MKSKKVRNISITLSCLAILSLVGIGFSTWILALGDGTTDLTVNINVETSINNSAILDYTASGTGGDSIELDYNNGKTTFDLTGQCKIIVGEDFISGKENLVIESTLVVESETKPQPNVVKPQVGTDSSTGTDYSTVENPSKNIFRGDESSLTYSYLEVSQETITISKDELTEYYSIDGNKIDGYKTITLDFSNSETTEKFGIKYGSFFDNLNPQDYYQRKIDKYKKDYENNRNEANLTNFLRASKAAKAELQTMQDDLKNAKITIKLDIQDDTNA